MNLFSKYKQLVEGASTLYKADGTGYTSRVISKNGKHVAKFFKDGVHMKSSDYEGTDPTDVHDFAKEEMEFRKKEKSESVIDEAKVKPMTKKGFELTIGDYTPNDNMVGVAKVIKAELPTDKIKDELTKKKSTLMKEDNLDERIHEPQGHVHQPDPITDASKEDEGRKKKMMGNRTPMEIIAKILAGK